MAQMGESSESRSGEQPSVSTSSSSSSSSFSEAMCSTTLHSLLRTSLRISERQSGDHIWHGLQNNHWKRDDPRQQHYYSTASAPFDPAWFRKGAENFQLNIFTFPEGAQMQCKPKCVSLLEVTFCLGSQKANTSWGFASFLHRFHNVFMSDAGLTGGQEESEGFGLSNPNHPTESGLPARLDSLQSPSQSSGPARWGQTAMNTKPL